jgi:O-antigen/teichoic acid export membrane protein
LTFAGDTALLSPWHFLEQSTQAAALPEEAGREDRMTDGNRDNDGKPRAASVIWVLAATGVSGVSGYLVLWLVARALGPAGYAPFGVFWSGLFLIVGVLFGIQQEATRATAAELHSPAAASAPRNSLWVFAAGTAVVVTVVVAATGLWWAPLSLGAANANLLVQISLGSGANAVVATLSGVLAGARLWRHLGAIIAIDGVVRLLAVSAVLGIGADASALAWAVILPFPVSLGLVFLASPRALIRFSTSTLGYRRLIANSAQTMLAASATALIINGFPLVLAFFAATGDKAQLGALILAITITRAPVLVPLMALQSYLVTRFTGMTVSPWRLIGQAFALIAAVMVVLGLATLFWGTEAFATFIREDFALSTAALVPLVVSSGFIGTLCVTGPALLALGRHRSYAAGWLVASGVAVALLFLPVSLEAKAARALSVGPVAGLLVHLAALWRVTRVARRSDRERTRPTGTASPGRDDTATARP